jgi:hypothetical protein
MSIALNRASGGQAGSPFAAQGIAKLPLNGNPVDQRHQIVKTAMSSAALGNKP